MDTETRSSLNSKSFLYTIRPMHLSDEPKKSAHSQIFSDYVQTLIVKKSLWGLFQCPPSKASLLFIQITSANIFTISGTSLNDDHSHFNVINRSVGTSCSSSLNHFDHVKTFFDFTEYGILAVKMRSTTY